MFSDNQTKPICGITEVIKLVKKVFQLPVSETKQQEDSSNVHSKIRPCLVVLEDLQSSSLFQNVENVDAPKNLEPESMNAKVTEEIKTYAIKPCFVSLTRMNVSTLACKHGRNDSNQTGIAKDPCLFKRPPCRLSRYLNRSDVHEHKKIDRKRCISKSMSVKKSHLMKEQQIDYKILNEKVRQVDPKEIESDACKKTLKRIASANDDEVSLSVPSSKLITRSNISYNLRLTGLRADESKASRNFTGVERTQEQQIKPCVVLLNKLSSFTMESARKNYLQDKENFLFTKCGSSSLHNGIKVARQNEKVKLRNRSPRRCRKSTSKSHACKISVRRSKRSQTKQKLITSNTSSRCSNGLNSCDELGGYESEEFSDYPDKLRPEWARKRQIEKALKCAPPLYRVFRLIPEVNLTEVFGAGNEGYSEDDA